jgi:hypothetical protein
MNTPHEMDGFAKKHQRMLRFIRKIKNKGCYLCKFKPKSWGEFEFHNLSTHGMPRELIPELCSQ